MLDLMIPWVSILLHTATRLVQGAAQMPLQDILAGSAPKGNFPSIGPAERPDGFGSFEHAARYVMFVVYFIASGGWILFFVGVMINHRRGNGGGHVVSAFWMIVGTAGIPAAPLLVYALIMK